MMSNGRPEHFVPVRQVPGGVAPHATAQVLEQRAQSLAMGQAWYAAAQQRLATAERRRNLAVAQLLA